MRNSSFFRLITWVTIVLLCTLAFSACGQDAEKKIPEDSAAAQMQRSGKTQDLDADAGCLPALAGDIAQVLPMEYGTVAVLYTDGTVGVAGNEELAGTVSAWKNVVQLYLGTEEGTLVARRADGTAVSTEYDLSEWHNVKELYVCWQGIAGLTERGEIVAVGPWEYSNPDGWTGIRDFWISDGDCFGLKEDGTVICEEQSYYEKVLSWKNVQQLYFTPGIIAILEDGGVAANFSGDYELGNLRGAVKFIDSGWPFALSADGRLLALTAEDHWVYNNGDYFTNLSRENVEEYPNIYIHDARFQNIKDIWEHNALVMLKYDGTVDTVNVDHYWDLSGWKEIEKIVTTDAEDHGCGPVRRIYGVRKDGSVIVAESEYNEESITMDNYLGWRVLALFKGQNERFGLESVVGITPEGTLVGDGYYADTDFSVLLR